MDPTEHQEFKNYEQQASVNDHVNYVDWIWDRIPVFAIRGNPDRVIVHRSYLSVQQAILLMEYIYEYREEIAEQEYYIFNSERSYRVLNLEGTAMLYNGLRKSLQALNISL